MKKRIKNKQLSDASVPKNNILVGLKKKLKEREREKNELCRLHTNLQCHQRDNERKREICNVRELSRRIYQA